MSTLEHWTPGHRPTRIVQFPSGEIRIIWTRPGMTDAQQTISDEGLARLRARRTLPPIEQLTEEDLP